MRCVVQRMREGRVFVDGEVVGEIGHGLLVLCGFLKTDTKEIVDYIVGRLVKMRIFPDENDKLNRSVIDENGEILVVSNFTLYANCAHGTRPDFSRAASGKVARPMYDYFVEELKKYRPVATGMFGAHMELDLYSDGPITVILEKENTSGNV